MLGELRLDSASLQNELAEEALIQKALVVVTHAHFFDNDLQVIDGFRDEALAVLEKLPPLVAGSQVVISHDVVYTVQHAPVY